MSAQSQKSRLIKSGTISVVLAMFTSFGLAWGSAFWVSFGSSVDESKGVGISSAEWWMVGRKNVYGGVRYTSIVMIRATAYEERESDLRVPRWAKLPEPAVLGPPFRNEHYEIVEARGWPLPMLSYRFSGRGRGPARTGDVSGGFELQPWSTGAWYSPRVLPLTPIWVNLLGNVVVHASVWFALLAGASEGRRAWRRTRSRCTECGYLLVGLKHGMCPECGQGTR